MSDPSPHDWLRLFCDFIGYGPAFCRALATALGKEFAARVGTGTEGFTLVPPEGGAADVTINSAGVATVTTDLVGPDAEGYRVTVAWRATGVSRPLPGDAALEPAAASGSLEAWWAALPADEMARAYAAGKGPPWPASSAFPFHAGEYPFAVEWRPFPWPDVWLELRMSGGIPDFVPGKVVEALQDVQEGWNSRRIDGASGLIHQVGTAAAIVASDVFVVNIDFGSAAPAALLAMLRALAAMTDSVAVTRVIAGSAVLAQSPVT